ncbi:MAG: hypothetical protein H7Y28_03485, partial [Rhodoferax sp.]|nr:hypothetical protein [Rhodoferax sp.]
MNPNERRSTPSWTARLFAVVCAMAVGACSLLKPSTTEPPAFYSLNAAPTALVRAPDGAARSLPTLIITPPRAAAGFDHQRIIYLRNDHQLEYFAHSEWVDTPARMLGPLL